MPGRLFFLLIALFTAYHGAAQRRCAAFEYCKAAGADLLRSEKKQGIENFIQSRIEARDSERPLESLIKIPVVVHVVYHLPEENIPAAYIHKQIEALNRDYRRQNSDSVNTPPAFRSKAADCNIEFELARVDPLGRATTGIERIYTPITQWDMDDKVKSISTYGAEAWDGRSYLNIWVCNLYDLLGYSSEPGDDLEKDGIVISYLAASNLDDGSPYGLGRTAVHETGHWLGLHHLWGDADCGDDNIADTPRQTTFTSGCPTGVRVSCNKSPEGDMYMNFMDFTDDPCTNLFTRGQKDRMRVLFDQGGYRNTILSSKALGLPWSQNIPLPDDGPRWLYAQVYPNPAHDDLVIDLRYDQRWIGRELTIVNASGQTIRRHIISSKVESIKVGDLVPGIYFLHAIKDGERLTRKFIRH